MTIASKLPAEVRLETPHVGIAPSGISASDVLNSASGLEHRVSIGWLTIALPAPFTKSWNHATRQSQLKGLSAEQREMAFGETMERKRIRLELKMSLDASLRLLIQCSL